MRISPGPIALAASCGLQPFHSEVPIKLQLCLRLKLPYKRHMTSPQFSVRPGTTATRHGWVNPTVWSGENAPARCWLCKDSGLIQGRATVPIAARRCTWPVPTAFIPCPPPSHRPLASSFWSAHLRRPFSLARTCSRAPHCCIMVRITHTTRRTSASSTSSTRVVASWYV